MSRYFRHIGDIPGESGITVTAENKKVVDRLVHAFLDVEYKDCPATWAAFKERVRDDGKARKKFIS